jgi:helicase MOV-10
MERLMNLPVYKKDPQTGKYNERMITKLLLNFRSHEKILELSNKAFYEGELVAKGDPKSTNWAQNWCQLPNKQFPVIFHPGYEAHRKEKSSLSNQNEVDIIAKYVKLILTFGINGREVQQADIGMISPYKRQCQRLSMKCTDNNWKDIEVGTVESFQGREKDVIFISTVRSNTNCVGFLNNPKVNYVPMEVVFVKFFSFSA